MYWKAPHQRSLRWWKYQHKIYLKPRVLWHHPETGTTLSAFSNWQPQLISLTDDAVAAAIGSFTCRDGFLVALAVGTWSSRGAHSCSRGLRSHACGRRIWGKACSVVWLGRTENFRYVLACKCTFSGLLLAQLFPELHDLLFISDCCFIISSLNFLSLRFLFFPSRDHVIFNFFENIGHFIKHLGRILVWTLHLFFFPKKLFLVMILRFLYLFFLMFLSFPCLLFPPPSIFWGNFIHVFIVASFPIATHCWGTPASC